MIGLNYLAVDLGKRADAAAARKWSKAHGIQILNVAGPRESKIPGTYQKAVRFLREILREE